MWWGTSVRLFSPRPHRLRHDTLAAIGAPVDRPGVFGPVGAWQDALAAVAAHRVSLVDPVDPRLYPMLWWALRPDTERTGNFIGPAIYFDPTAFTAPTLPAGGVSVDEALPPYLKGAPGTRKVGRNGSTPPLWRAMIELAAAKTRIEVRRYRSASPFWRRTVPAPTGRVVQPLDAWLARQKALPSPQDLARWYAGVRAAQWHKLAIGRLVDDLATGDVIAYRAGREAIPASWFQSDVELDRQHGALFGQNDRHRPLVADLRLHRADDVPAVSRFATQGAAVKHTIEQHCAELARLPRESQIDYLAERLSGIARATISGGLRSAFGAGRRSYSKPTRRKAA